ncbi:Endonuclease 4 [Maioricimonas rarisocia]|uniref:Probable endonuclease 4 n=1 Tax=Maioricimonas rarisocia TaxID=2528026 RepID=A0A517Z8I6_9PLAN|nr:deoxyribonuclease IV [Maioricimonas rarisocia]QDU38798.1 Endonuclease 4 [Maioricimonas rarisocia]
MPLLGAHMSIAGGCFKAVDAAHELEMDTVQIFTKNNNQWKAKLLEACDIEQFAEALERTGVQIPSAHASYLINMGSPKDDLWRKSLDAFVVELERGEALGLAGLVIHPGSYVDSDEQSGLERIGTALVEALDRTDGCSIDIWLETTAGQGTNLGHRFEHLAQLIEAAGAGDRLGICVDTCHIFAAGYDIRTAKGYRAAMKELDDVVGLDRVRAWHLNDSKKPLGSRVDRHEHIGEGEIGLEAFRQVLNDRRFRKLPMYLETKKEKRDGEEMDAVNLRTLRELLK